MTPPRATALVVLALALAPPASAQPRPGGVVGELAAQTAAAAAPALGRLPAPPRVGVRVVGAAPGDVPARFVDAVRAAAGEGATVAPVAEGADPEAAALAARAAGHDAVVFVALSLDGASLAARTTVVRARADFWETFVDPAPRPPAIVAEASAARRVDAATRALLGAAARWPAAPLARPRMVATPFRGTVALAAGDLDGDGRDEVVVTTLDRVRVARFTGGSLAFVGEASLAALGWSPSPLRQPLGATAWDAATRRVRVRTSRQAVMGEVALANNAVTLVPAAGGDLYPAPGFGCVALAPGADTVRALAPDCAHAAAPVGGLVAAVPVAFARADAAGATHRVEALADGAGGCVVRIDGARVATVANVAPPLALADLDDDGRVELLAASASAPGAADALRVVSLSPAGAEERPGFTVPGPIEALAVGDLDGDGLREVVVGALDPQRRATTLWVLP